MQKQTECIDCKACALAQQCSKRDYSISEELTEKSSGNFSILYLVIAAAATLACAVFFTWLFT